MYIEFQHHIYRKNAVKGFLGDKTHNTYCHVCVNQGLKTYNNVLIGFLFLIFKYMV